jgi:hypothetical protein
MKQITQALLAIILAPLLAACASRQGGTYDTASLGKINIVYHYSSQDAKEPPAGFNVYRASMLRGPFERVNADMIKAAPSPKAGLQQELVTDYGLPLGSELFYYVEKVSPAGVARKATNVAPAVVVLPMQPEDARHLRQVAARSSAKAVAGAKPGARTIPAAPAPVTSKDSPMPSTSKGTSK